MEQNTLPHDFENGDVVKARNFAGTVVQITGRQIHVENRDGDVQVFDCGDLKYTC